MMVSGVMPRNVKLRYCLSATMSILLLAGSGCMSIAITSLKPQRFPEAGSPRFPPTSVDFKYYTNDKIQPLYLAINHYSIAFLLESQAFSSIAMASESDMVLRFQYRESFSPFWESMQVLSLISIGIIPTMLRTYITLSVDVVIQEKVIKQYEYSGHILDVNSILLIIAPSGHSGP